MSGHYATNPHYAPDASYREDAERLERAEAAAGKWFADLTAPQLAAHRATVESAAVMHGRGSDAHLASINLANRQWAHDTTAARGVYDMVLEDMLRDGEISETASYAYDAVAAAAKPALTARKSAG